MIEFIYVYVRIFAAGNMLNAKDKLGINNE